MRQVVHADLHEKTLWNPSYFLLNPYLNSAILTFHIKSFMDMQKSMKTAKIFCLKTFMVYGMSPDNLRVLIYVFLQAVPYH